MQSYSLKKIPHTETWHGETRIDDYFWLREKDNPEVLEHLRRQNEITQNYMHNTQALQDELYSEMVGRIQETDTSVPYRQGAHLYFSKTFAGKQYPVYCRKTSEDDLKETVLLDLNALANGHSYLSLGFKSVSPNGELLAYSLDTNGSEVYTLYVKHIDTNHDLGIKIENVAGFAWAGDNTTFFYTTRDASLRPYRVYRHHIGATSPDGTQDALIFEETDVEFTVSVGLSKNEKFIFMECRAGNTSEWHFLPSHTPQAAWTILSPRNPGHEYSVEAHADDFYILTNRNGKSEAKNFRLVRAPITQFSQWTEILAHDEAATLKGLEVFKSRIVVLERRQGLENFLILNPKTWQIQKITQPEDSYSVDFAANANFDAPFLRYEYTSLTTPTTTFDFHFETGEKTVRKVQPVLGGYRSEDYRAERLWIAAKDGTQIPVSLVYKKSIDRSRPHPLFLTGYGAYGISYDVYFSPTRVSLLNRGIIYAIAHIRGGGDMGESWREDGKMLKKKNTFTDFIACAEGLIAKGYTTSSQLIIQGGSAGGLLMGAVTNMRPDLFKAVIADVPFVDTLNTMLDASLPLTTGEYVEWGNPGEKEFYDYIRSYCPYSNVAAKPYPTILVKSGLNDPRVAYWEGAKWAAKLSENTTSNNPILLKTNMGAGHGGSSGRYDKFKEIAFDYAFVLKQILES